MKVVAKRNHLVVGEGEILEDGSFVLKLQLDGVASVATIPLLERGHTISLIVNLQKDHEGEN